MPVKVTDFISTTDPSDTYATHDSFLGRGGFKEVANIAARDAIPLARRTVGMLVITQDTGRVWKLTNAGTNTYTEVLVLEGTITSPTDGQILEYDTGTGKWVNATPTGGGAAALADLTDVDYDPVPDAGDVLAFNGTMWEPTDFIWAGNAFGTQELPGVANFVFGGPESPDPNFIF